MRESDIAADSSVTSKPTAPAELGALDLERQLEGRVHPTVECRDFHRPRRTISKRPEVLSEHRGTGWSLGQAW